MQRGEGRSRLTGSPMVCISSTTTTAHPVRPEVLSFVGASAASCVFSTFSTLLATLSSTASIAPGDPIDLLASTVKVGLFCYFS